MAIKSAEFERILGFSATVERDAKCQMRDGTILRSDIYY